MPNNTVVEEEEKENEIRNILDKEKDIKKLTRDELIAILDR